MVANHPRTLLLSSDALARYRIGALMVHGRTIVRASPYCATLLGTTQLIGRDMAQLLSQPDLEAIKDWFDSIAEDPHQAPTLAAARLGDEGTALVGLSLAAEAPADGQASTRVIIISAAPQDDGRHAGNEAESSSANELKRTMRELLDGNPVATFVLNAEHRVLHWNRACECTLGVTAAEMVGSRNHWRPFHGKPRPLLADLVVEGTAEQYGPLLFGSEFGLAPNIANAYQATAFFEQVGEQGSWFRITAAPLRSANGQVIGAIETLVDITDEKRSQNLLIEQHQRLEALVQQRTAMLERTKNELELDIAKRERAEAELLRRYSEMTQLNLRLAEANEQIKEAQNQLLQNEKLASIGQLAAGVAHEINNPIGYVFSNVGALEAYLNDLFALLDAYIGSEAELPAAEAKRLATLRKEVDIGYIREDAEALLRESKEGIERVRKIVQDLKDFSHVDASPEWQWADIQPGLESTLNIVNNELKYAADVQRRFEPLPQIQCLPSQLNQVFMNLLVNAGHAIPKGLRGTITVSTGVDADRKQVWVEIADTGTGIAAEHLPHIFEPFFTTKPIGKGTGLGLSLSYGIIAKHGGEITVASKLGEGTRFRVILPIEQPQAQAEAA